MLETIKKIRENVLENFSCRMTRKQKKSFIKYVFENFQNVKIEKSIFGKNIIIGDVEKAKRILGAHYDTPPRMPTWFMKHMVFCSFIGLPLFLTAFQYTGLAFILFLNKTFAELKFESLMFYFLGIYQVMLLAFLFHLFGVTFFFNKTNFNDNSSGVLVLLEKASKMQDSETAYVLFDNEEKGLFGSFAFKIKNRKKIKDKEIIIFDCIGQGDVVNLYYCRKKTNIVEKLYSFFQQNETTCKLKRSNLISMSDHVSFRKMNHVLVLMNFSKRNKNALSTIHCKNDNRIDFKNIDMLKGVLENG